MHAFMAAVLLRMAGVGALLVCQFKSRGAILRRHFIRLLVEAGIVEGQIKSVNQAGFAMDSHGLTPLMFLSLWFLLRDDHASGAQRCDRRPYRLRSK